MLDESLTQPVKLLDHGFVRLVDKMGSDLSIVRAARVSHDAAWRAGLDEGSDYRLIRYLWKHKHSTPFESVVVTLEIKAPIFVVRQWFRHRTQTYNEVSARYTELPSEFYVPDINLIGRQSARNKQARDLEALPLELLQRRQEEVMGVVAGHRDAFQRYKHLLASGWPRELARTVLPVAIYTHFFTTVNLWNLFRFLSERIAWDAQYEIRVYAQAIVDLIRPFVPVAVDAWHEDTFRWVPTDQIRREAYQTKRMDVPMWSIAQRWDQPITGRQEWRKVLTMQPTHFEGDL